MISQKVDGPDIIYRLIPAGETEFAKDAAFGYKSSNLRQVSFWRNYFGKMKSKT